MVTDNASDSTVACPDDADRAALAAAVRDVLAADGERTASVASTAHEGALVRAVSEVARLVPARPASATAERGHAGAGHARIDGATPAADPEQRRHRIRPGDAMLVLAHRHFADQLEALQLHAPQALAGLSPEGVHQMRVAIRRIRAALQAFQPILPGATVRRWVAEFRWLGRTLGRVRDLDVYRERLQREIADLGAEHAAALAPYQEHLRAEYGDARTQMIAALDSERYTRLIAAVAAFVEREPSAAALRRWGSFRVCDGAPGYIDAAILRVRKRGRRVREGTPSETLHELRIRAKRLRYLIEIFVPVYGKPLQKRIKPVKRLQDTLGEHQDACVATQQLRGYAESLASHPHATEQLLALGCLMHLQAEAAADARRRFAADWKRFERQLKRGRLRDRLAAAADD